MLDSFDLEDILVLIDDKIEYYRNRIDYYKNSNLSDSYCKNRLLKFKSLYDRVYNEFMGC